MATRAGQRGRRGVALAQEIPADMAGRWELLVKLAGENLYKMRDNLRQAVGQRSFKGQVNDDDELARRWASIANDPDALAELLSSNAKYTVDGRVLVPNELIAMMQNQHRRRLRGGYD